VAVVLLVNTVGAIIYLLVAPSQAGALARERGSVCPALSSHREHCRSFVEGRATTPTSDDGSNPDHGTHQGLCDRTTLDAVDLVVQERWLFGFLGPNRAGKTTTLRILTALARPTSGSVQVLGHEVTSAGNTVRAPTSASCPTSPASTHD
jgi:hypothetical protein